MKNMRALLLSCLVLFLFSCEKEETSILDDTPVQNMDPEIYCGTAWSTACLDAYWSVNKSNQATLTVVPNGYNGKNSLLLYNPHGPNEINPTPLRLNAVIKNIKPDAAYQVSFYAKIKGYPDFHSNPSLAAYAFKEDNWYNQMYYGSKGGEYHDKDWSKYSFPIIGKNDPTLNFELYSLYDSTWISDLKIEEM